MLQRRGVVAAQQQQEVALEHRRGASRRGPPRVSASALSSASDWRMSLPGRMPASISRLMARSLATCSRGYWRSRVVVAMRLGKAVTALPHAQDVLRQPGFALDGADVQECVGVLDSCSPRPRLTSGLQAITLAVHCCLSMTFPALVQRAPACPMLLRYCLAAAVLTVLLASGPARAAETAQACPAVLNYTFNRLQTGKPESLCQYRGKVLLIVNTASYLRIHAPVRRTRGAVPQVQVARTGRGRLPVERLRRAGARHQPGDRGVLPPHLRGRVSDVREIERDKPQDQSAVRGARRAHRASRRSGTSTSTSSTATASASRASARASSPTIATWWRRSKSCSPPRPRRTASPTRTGCDDVPAGAGALGVRRGCIQRAARCV